MADKKMHGRFVLTDPFGRSPFFWILILALCGMSTLAFSITQRTENLVPTVTLEDAVLNSQPIEASLGTMQIVIILILVMGGLGLGAWLFFARIRRHEAELEPAMLNKTILVVEDEVEVREMIQRVLQSQGYQVVCAGSAEEALDLFRRSDQPFDLLLTDMVMPDQNGWDLYTQLASETPALKALFISAYSERAVGEGEIFERRMPFLRKPFRASELALRVGQLMGRETVN